MQNLGKEYRDDKAGIFLRLMTPQDTDLIIAWRNSDQVRKNFIYQEPFTRAGHENWIRTMIDTGKALQFVICDTKEGSPWAPCISGTLTESITRRSTGFLSERQMPGAGG